MVKLVKAFPSNGKDFVGSNPTSPTMTDYKRNGSCVEAIIYDYTFRKKILLIQRGHAPWQGFWGLPGGFVEFGENPLDAVKREVLEETAVNIIAPIFCGFHMEEIGDDWRQIAIYKSGADERRNSSEHLIELLVKNAEAGLSGSGEILDIGWFDLVDLPLQTVPGFASRLGHLINL